MNRQKKNSVLIKVQLTAVNVVLRPARRQPMLRGKTRVFDYIPVQTEIDPELVELQFRPAREKRSLRIGLLTMKKDDIRKLNLMVGDTMNIEVSGE